MINKDNIKYKIKRLIKKIPSECIVFRIKPGEFKQQTGEKEEIAKFEGCFQVTTSKQKYQVTDFGTIPISPNINLIAIVDEKTKLIKKDDIIQSGDYSYKVIDKIDMNKLGIYYSIVLEEIEWK